MKHSAAKRLSALALAAALLLTLGACGEGSGGGSSGQSQESASGGGDWPVRVRDVDIPEAPERVLSLSPGITEMLFDMGLGGRVAGVSDHCDYPAGEVDKRPRCGTVLSVKTSAVQRQDFDLVVAAAALPEQDLIWFQQQDIPVLVLERAESLEELRQNYLDLALALMGNTSGKNHGEGYWEELAGLIEEGAGYSDGSHPRAILLREMGYGMATGDTFEGSLLEELGFVNDATAYTDWLYDREDVADLEPDVIFADQSISIDEIKSSAIYQPVAAVLNDKIMNVDLTVFERQSPRMFQTLLEMARFAYGAE